MNHSKILSAAVIAALSAGGGIAQAAPSFDITAPAGTSTPPMVAMELFNDAPANPEETQALPSDSTFTTAYTLGLGTEEANQVKEPFTVVFRLEGAVWDNPPLATQFDLIDVGGTKPSISYQEVSETHVQYGVNASSTTPISGETKLELSGFKALVKQTTFASADAEAKLTITLSGGVDASASLTLTKSGKGLYVNFAPNNEDVKIDVGTSAKQFKGGTYAPLAANLGTMTIKYPDSKLKQFDLTTDWDAKSSGDGQVTAATLRISNGPFSASMTGNRVFIDTNDSGCSAYESGTDIRANVSDVKTATFTGVQALYPTNTTADPTTHKICVVVPGNAEIKETTEAPKALLTAKYTNRTKSGVPYPEGNLLWIKKNGVICTVYLVTDGETTADNTNVRITNTSGNSGTLRGTLVDQQGTEVFKDVVLGTTSKLYETIYVNSATLFAKAKAAGYDGPGDNGSGEFGRGELTIASDLPRMEVFSLLRNRASDVRPLLNMSLGASGNGCD